MHSLRPHQWFPLLVPSLWTNKSSALAQLLDGGILNVPDPIAAPASSSPSTPSQVAPAPNSASNSPAPSATPAPNDSSDSHSTPSAAASTPSPTQAAPNPSSPANQASPTSNAAPSSTSTPAAALSGSSLSSLHSSSPTAASSPTPSQSLKSQQSSIIYLTITATGSDGNVYTSVSSTASALPAPTGGSASSNSGGSSSANTWAIIGGVVGGLAALAAIIFIVFRCTQRRFSELDDEDVAIKWPELVNNRTDDSTTLNPLAARQAAGHGVGDDGDDEKPGLAHNQGLYSDHTYASELNRGDTVQSAMYSNSSYGPGPVGYGERSGYYDPYLGPSSAPQPFPPSIPYEHQQHPPYAPLAPPSPYPASRSVSPGMGLDQGEPEAYQMSWGGAEAIPLTVVNSGNGTAANRRTPSSPEHGPQ